MEWYLIIPAVFFVLGAVGSFIFSRMDAGADGLGTYFPILFCMFVMASSGIGFLTGVVSFFLPEEIRVYTVWLAVIAPFIGLAAFTYMMHRNSIQVTAQHNEYIEHHKSIAKTMTHRSAELGIEFTYISKDSNGAPYVVMEKDGQIIMGGQQLGSARIRTLTLPAGADLHDHVMKTFIPGAGGCTAEVVKQEVFTAMPENSEVVSIEYHMSSCEGMFGVVEDKVFAGLPVPPEDIFGKILSHDYETFSKEIDALYTEKNQKMEESFKKGVSPDMSNEKPPLVRSGLVSIYFIRYPADPSRVLVVGIDNEMATTPAMVEHLSLNDYQKNNLWYQQLRFVEQK